MFKHFCTILLIVMLLAMSGGAQQTSGRSPVLVNTCLVTNRVSELVDFYKRVLGIEARVVSDRYAEFPTGVGVLALFSAKAQEVYIPGSAQPAQNKSVILEFRVADVDREYQRLRNVVKSWVKGPTTQPWGTRSIYFRDPDGNLVDFWMPAPGR
jgi:catechol 2,3-dioxygenase-like lactoylglutathione lyase family enzyme